ncbi:MAG: alpha/beta fold hydrolase [Gammaproteobacteria bacterium]
MSSITELFRAAARVHGIEGVDFSPPSEHFVELNSVRLHYVDWGGSGTPILFLHGGGQTCRTWDLLAVQLRNRFRCIALDQRNHGDSGRDPQTGPFDNFVMASDARALLDKLKIKRFILVGMSMGGMNTLAFASRYHDGLAAISVVDVTPTVRPAGTRSVANFSAPKQWDSIEAALADAVKFNPLRAPEHLHYSLVHALRRREDGQWVWKHEFGGQPPPAADAPERNAALSERLWEEVPKITCPALILRGGESKVITHEDAERLTKLIANAQMHTIAGAGHTVQGDKPVDFYRTFIDFLDRHGL